MVTQAREAIILVGGMGTRLRPLTVHRAKPLLPVAGVPCIEHQLANLAAAGISHVVLATSYRAETFTEVLGDGSALGLRLDYVSEDEPLGTGGAIRNAAALLESGPHDAVIVLNGDVLSGHDLSTQVAMHIQRRADLTLHLTVVDDARAFGCVPTDGSGRVLAFLEKMPQPVSNQVNAGCYVFRRAVIDAIPTGRVVSVERETFPALLQADAVVLGYVEQAYWLDLGTPAALVAGSRDLVLGRMRSAALPGPVGEALVLPGARVAADAVVEAGSCVGPGASVGPGAQVLGSVLLEGAQVHAGAVLRDSIVGAGAVIGAGCVLKDAVIGDGAEVGADNELLGGIRVWCGARIGPAVVRFSSDR